MVAEFFTLIVLIFLEVVLGIDNIFVIAILVQNVEKSYRQLATQVGMFFAYFFRILFIFFAQYLLAAKKTVFALGPFDFSIAHLFFLAGGGFLCYSAINGLMHFHDNKSAPTSYSSIYLVIFQIIANDIVFSIDSVITAVALTPHLSVIIFAMTVAMLCMYFFSSFLISLIEEHPRIKILALFFVLAVGLYLIIEGFSIHFEKVYLIVLMMFTALYELTCHYKIEKNKKT